MLTGPLWNNVLILDKGTWSDVNTAAHAVRETFVTQLVNRHAEPVAQGLAYWKNLNWGLYWVQTLPFRFVSMDIRKIKGTFSSLQWRTSDSLWLKLFYGWRALIGLFVEPISTDVQTNLTELEDKYRSITHSVGALVSAERMEDLLDALYTCADLPKHNIHSTPEEAIIKLQDVLNFLRHDKGAHDGRPITALRWWPAWAFTLVSVWYVAGSWHQLLDWFDRSVLETLQSFWKNWILDPLYRIYLVVRHDPNGRVALMARGSLESDVASLERMVIDFVNDTNPSADLGTVALAARSGDMTPVLQAYERQIAHPLLPLLSGELLRTLLIQVQKTKVDAEVALSGIDNLLESQQLVFGLVAALPPLVVAWGAISALLRGIVGIPVRFTRSMKLRRDAFLIKLGNIDDILATSGPRLGLEEVGAVWCEVTLLRREIESSGFSTEHKKQLSKDLDRLLAVRQQSQALSVMNRVYIKYA